MELGLKPALGYLDLQIVAELCKEYYSVRTALNDINDRVRNTEPDGTGTIEKLRKRIDLILDRKRSIGAGPGIKALSVDWKDPFGP